MKLRRVELVNIILVAVAFIAAAFIYPALPERVASHWNIAGDVDGYVGRFWGAFLLPFVALGMCVLFFAVPRFDPKRNNIEKFGKIFDLFVLVLLIFLFYIYALTLFWTFGYRFNMGQFMAPGLAIIFFAAGKLIQKSEPNWSIGIRTPWTLSNETVWRKTHALGGKLFMATAVLTLVGALFPSLAFWFFIVPVILSSVISVVYSYTEYLKVSKNN